MSTEKGKKEWDFDEIIDRSNTNSVKWDPLALKFYKFRRTDLLAMWVADMDFKSPPTVINTIVNRAKHGIYGYNITKPDYYEEVINWFKRRHNWDIKQNWIIYTPGIVSAICFMIQIYSNPGDKIIIQEPVYYPFRRSIEDNGRIVLQNNLKLNDDHYQMDFKDLKLKAKDPRVKLLILCSPHNPIGRVWKKEELEELGEICCENNILVIADEIHCDLILPGHEHIPFASISDKLAQNSIICTSGSKTFNLPGLKQSNIIIPNDELRKPFLLFIKSLSLRMSNNFGNIALKEGYKHGEEWLDDLILYLEKNYKFLKDYLEKKLPGIKVYELQGTYLVWVDFRCFNLKPKKIKKIMENEAGVALDDGFLFGEGGDGFERFNIACPRKTLENALNQIVKAFKPYLKQ